MNKREQEHLQGVFQCVVEFHNGRLVSASITIIRGRENGHHISIVSFHDELMNPRVNPLEWLNVSEISCPKVYPVPQGEIPQPPRSSGPDQSRSHIGPSRGISSNLSSIVRGVDTRTQNLRADKRPDRQPVQSAAISRTNP